MNKDMIQVFARVNYSVLSMPGFFDQFHKFIGHFQIQQTVEQSYNKMFDVWFFTDQVEFQEGESRQVEITCITDEEKKMSFKISK